MSSEHAAAPPPGVTPDELVAGSSREHLRRNGVPTAEQQSARRRADRLIRDVLADELMTDGLIRSPLGTGWTDVFEAVVRPAPDPGRLESLGWLRLDPLLGRLGISDGTSWAVIDGNQALAAVHLRSDPPTDRVSDVLDRADARGEMRLREMLELRTLRADGQPFPQSSVALAAAADIESGLDHRELVRWATGRRAAAPVRLGGRRRRLVVACSGVDGAGKTTLLASLRSDLEQLGVPVSRVWLRPGMGLGPLTALAARVKRRIGVDERPGIAAVAENPDVTLRSRKGLVGWVWSLLVTLSFVVGVRRQHADSHGVVLYDRHLADALVTLEFAYAGSDLRLQRWLLLHLMPGADLSFHLDVSADEAVRRKPGDPIGERAVRRQLDAYDAALSHVRGVRRLDATEPPADLARTALEALVRA